MSRANALNISLFINVHREAIFQLLNRDGFQHEATLDSLLYLNKVRLRFSAD